MDFSSYLDLAILNLISAGVVIAGFVYCVYLNGWMLARMIPSRWYRICVGALAFSIWGVATVLISIIFGCEAASSRHTHIAGMIEKLVMIELVVVGVSFVVSAVSLAGGVIMTIRKSRQGRP